MQPTWGTIKSEDIRNGLSMLIQCLLQALSVKTCSHLKKNNASLTFFLSYPSQTVSVWNCCPICSSLGKVAVTWLRKIWTTATTMMGKVILIHTTTITLSSKLYLNRDWPLATVDLKAAVIWNTVLTNDESALVIHEILVNIANIAGKNSWSKGRFDLRCSQSQCSDDIREEENLCLN